MRLAFSLFATALCICAPSHANLLAGGGFETPVAPTASYLLNVTPSGWTGTGDTVAQGYAGSVSSGNGRQWFDLNPGANTGSGISQQVMLSGGMLYGVSFLYNGGQPNAGFTTAITVSVTTPNSTVFNATVSTASMDVYSGTPWALYTDTFAVGADTVATFKFMPNGTWANGFIDAASLTAVTAVPEPGGVALMLVGLAALLPLTRRLKPQSDAPPAL